MALPKLGTPCIINIYSSTRNSSKWGTTHPNRVEGMLEGYLQKLSERWIIHGSGATLNIERRPPV